MRVSVLAALAAALSLSLAGNAQVTASKSVGAPKPAPLQGSIASHPEWPAGTKDPHDTDTIGHLISALYDVISGPSTKPRDWERFRSLFLPDGRLGLVRPSVGGKPSDVYLLTPDEYAKRNDPYFHQEGFFEHSLANRLENFGNLTSVWSSYESRHAPEDKPFARGVNSIQIVHAQGRFWIASILWDDEREGVVLPDKYLHSQ